MSNKTDVVSCHYQSEYWNLRSRVVSDSTEFAGINRTNSWVWTCKFVTVTTWLHSQSDDQKPQFKQYSTYILTDCFSYRQMCTFIKTMRLRIWCFLQSGLCIQMQDRQSSASRSSRSQWRMFNLCNKLKRKILKERLTLILWQESNLDSYDHLITSKFSDIKWDIRMTSENVANLKIESQLTLTEWEILMTVLFKQKSALSWHFSHLKDYNQSCAVSEDSDNIT
jgi:hypothetical protein